MPQPITIIFIRSSIIHCTNNYSCPDEYPSLIQEKKECIKENTNIYQSSDIFTIIDSSSKFESYLINENETQKNVEKYNNINDVIQDLIINKNKTEDKGKDKEYYNNIINKVESIFTSGKYDTSKLDSGKDEIITAEKITITLTTSKNQKNNTNNNMTIIDLGECENILRNSNKISEDEPLYIKKTDVIQDGFNIPKIEYEVYCKCGGDKLTQLNLSVCDNTTISLSIPIALSGNKDKFNSSSDYYKNKCYSSTSDSGTDMIIKDRQKEFVDNGLTVCQEECFFKDYNS